MNSYIRIAVHSLLTIASISCFSTLQAQNDEILISRFSIIQTGISYEWETLYDYKLSSVSPVNLRGGIGVQIDDGILGFLLGISYHNASGENLHDIEKSVDMNKLSADLEFFRSFISILGQKSITYIGGVTALNYSRTEYEPLSTSEYSWTLNCFCGSLGLNAMIFYPISENLDLIVSTQINIAEYGLARELSNNPAIMVEDRTNNVVVRNAPRPRLELNVGLAF